MRFILLVLSIETNFSFFLNFGVNYLKNMKLKLYSDCYVWLEVGIILVFEIFCYWCLCGLYFNIMLEV